MRFVLDAEQFFIFNAISKISMKLHIELSGFMIYKLIDQDILLEDILIPRQRGTAVHTTIDKAELAEVTLRMTSDDRMVGFFHTHLGEFGHSAFDKEFGQRTAKEYISPFLSVVVASSSDIFAKIWERCEGRIFRRIIICENLDVQVRAAKSLAAIEKEIMAKLLEKPPLKTSPHLKKIKKFLKDL